MAKIAREGGALTPKKIVKIGAKSAEAVVGYKLPDTKTVAVPTLLGYITLLFGEKKIGKTSMLAEGGDKTFFAFFEPGGKSLEIFASVFTRWSDFRSAVNQIIASKRYNHVVMDTVDLAYKLSAKAARKKLGIDYEGDAAYGKGWAASREEFEAPVMQLVNAGIAVTFISHADDRDVTLRDGTVYTKLSPTMPKQARELVEGLVDIWAYYGYDGKRRVLTIQGDDNISAGHRLVKHFKTPDGVPVREIDMGASAAEAWKNFNDAFHNRYTPPLTKKAAEEGVSAPKKVFKKLKSGGR